MNYLISKRIALAVCVVGIFGCADMATNFGGSNKGLLVAQLFSDTAADFMTAEAIIDGKYYAIKHKSDVAISLPAGKYLLEGFLTPKTTFPVRQQFEIKAGKATNLGSIAIMHHKKFTRTMKSNTFDASRSGKHLIVYMDNSDSFGSYFNKEHPKLYASLSNKNIGLAPGIYIDSKQLRLIRRYIAILEFKKQRYRPRYVAGPLGTVAYVRRGKSGKPLATVVDITTLEDMRHCSANKYKMACLLSETEYLFVRKKKVKFRGFPPKFSADSMFVSRKGRLIAINQKYNVLVSKNNGKSWKDSNTSKTKIDLNETSIHNFQFYETRSNQFIYPKMQPKNKTVVLRKSRKNNKYSRYDIPESVDQIKEFVFSRKGVLIYSNNSKARQSRVYFKRFGSKNWQEQAFGIDECSGFGFKKRTILVKCQDATWASKNGGRAWSKRSKK